MSEAKKIESKISSPFSSRITAESKKDFDKYYLDVSVKQVFKSSGKKDEDGEELGVCEDKVVVKKIDIFDLLESQRDLVGVASYMKALAVQGVDVNSLSTVVDSSVQDFTNVPSDKMEGALYGDRAIEIFKNLPSDLKSGHTTIEGFLKSLTQESIDNYIKGRVEALTPKNVEVKEGE